MQHCICFDKFIFSNFLLLYFFNLQFSFYIYFQKSILFKFIFFCFYICFQNFIFFYNVLGSNLESLKKKKSFLFLGEPLRFFISLCFHFYSVPVLLVFIYSCFYFFLLSFLQMFLLLIAFIHFTVSSLFVLLPQVLWI